MVRIGVIGLGTIFKCAHLPQLENIENCKITAICDINTDKLKEYGDKLNIDEKYRFTNYKDLIECEIVDAVEILTPNCFHIEMAKYAAQNKKAVEIEKPLSTDFSGVDELIKVIENNNTVNMMCFSYRFKPAVRYAKKLIEEGKLGKIVNVSVEYLKDSAFWSERRLEWRFIKSMAGSGVLGDLGVHLADMTKFLVGDFKTVYALKDIVVKERLLETGDEKGKVETDDIVSFVAKLENDVLANFTITRCALGNANTITYKIYGTKGVINFNLNNPEELTYGILENSDRHIEMITEKVPDEFLNSRQEQTFINAVMGSKADFLPDVYEGAKCQKIVDAILKSSETGLPVEL